MNKVSEIWDTLGTTWNELSSTDRERIESVWSLLVEEASKTNMKAIQRENNFSLFLAPPLFTAPPTYFRLYATTEDALKELGLSTLLYQHIPENLIYTESITGKYLEEGKEKVLTLSYGGSEYTTTENVDDKPLVDEIYMLGSKGLIKVDESHRPWPVTNESAT